MTTTPDVGTIHAAVRARYTEVARTAAGQFTYPTGRDGMLALHYDLARVRALPEAVVESFCGVGNPWTLGRIAPGDVVLDIGCGAGVDLCLASHSVGPQGRVYGIDLTPAMVRRAQQNLHQIGVDNAQVVLARAEELPFVAARCDVVLSNGVLNLSPCKLQSLREIWRVLKPGGRLQYADIVLQEALPAEITSDLDAWAG